MTSKLRWDSDIEQIDWMSPETKAKAEEKLHAVADKIGYPGQVARLLEARPSSPAMRSGTQCARAHSKSTHQLNKIGKPVNREEWG